MIQLTRAGAVIGYSSHELKDATTQFARDKAIIFRDFLTLELAMQISELFGEETFVPRIYRNLGRDEAVLSAPSVWALEFLLNNPTVFNFVEAVSGCSHVGIFSGRISRQKPGADHFDWHTDVCESRLVALSINLSIPNYEGGELDIRSKSTEEILMRLGGLGFGDAMLFHINGTLEHRTRPVSGQWPRIHYAGWFRGEPDFLDLLRGF